MPVTNTEFPILAQFLCVVQSSDERLRKSMQNEATATRGDQSNGGSAPSVGATATDSPPKQLPKGVVIGKDGKPCRSCTSASAWIRMAKENSPPTQRPTVTTKTTTSLPNDCPADVEVLGRSSWTMLHTLAANYPSRPTPVMQQQTRSFLSLFSNLYPCSHCAEDFRDWIGKRGNEPRVESQDELGVWMCEAHNAVNEKLGKDIFDCEKWKERWVTGPPDGRCG